MASDLAVAAVRAVRLAALPALSPPIKSTHMDSFKNAVAFWANLLGTLLALVGAIQSVTWLLAAGVLVVVGSIIVLAYANKQRQLLKLAGLKVADRSIDSLNVASLRRRLNRSLVIQSAENFAIIDGEDLAVTWKCSGYCQADRATVIEFSIDADANTPFDELECSGYDLRGDPRRQHRIRPILVGPDGISKKVAVPFLAPLSAQEPFSVLLKFNLPGCMKAGVDYYTATLSFQQERVQRYTMRLTFNHDLPAWLRVYECLADGAVSLLKDLRPLHKNSEVCEYLDAAEDVSASSARIYVFSRSAPIAKAA